MVSKYCIKMSTLQAGSRCHVDYLSNRWTSPTSHFGDDPLLDTDKQTNIPTMVVSGEGGHRVNKIS